MYTYTCKLNLNCPKNCYILSKYDNKFEIYQCNSESHNHNDVSELTKRRNLLNDMFLKDNFQLEEINRELAKAGLSSMDQQQFSNYKRKQKNKLNMYSFKSENSSE